MLLVLSGSQAIKALRESNVETILINPNVSCPEHLSVKLAQSPAIDCHYSDFSPFSI